MNKQVTIIVGNGFNYLIKQIIEYEFINGKKGLIPSRSISANFIPKLEKIITLWEKFDSAFSEIKNKHNEKQISDEELIKLIYAILDFFSNMEGLEKVLTKEQLESLKQIFDEFVSNRINAIIKEFFDYQKNGCYGELKSLFPNFAPNLGELLSKKEVSKFHIFTTNYDGILDTLLTLPDNAGFLTRDGFAQPYPYDKNLLQLTEDYLKHHRLCLHVHGSYKFERHHGLTYKTKSNSSNNNPAIIFNDPDLKERFIYNDNVLSAYFDKLKESLNNNDKLIILGNSLQSDPHIAKAIKNNFNRHNTNLYICDRTNNIGNVRSRIWHQGSKYAIVSKPTDEIKSMKDFFNFVEEMV